MTAPAVELLQFMDMELKKENQQAERERARVWLNYLVNVFTQPSMGKEDPKFAMAKKEFIESIKPEQKKGQAKVYEYDFELMKRLKASQEGGG
ncbi:hypothetical protein B481_1993 [Planococcus halocryophilus Or1]|uniref:Uncharacterized protein n=2 Tax=Planococcus halocryophilus TaxID=1215089 RepID=A0A1C7DPY3_9BACL|nr:hypothetical protein [Planococcus halocryophilus]ANU13462.1 hypothetical protein BBI08_06230 [Planococcus halocryophilus]EMF46266.1 hypothetical protein B481_1993 [Planococcus halocryophilus Or1]